MNAEPMDSTFPSSENIFTNGVIHSLYHPITLWKTKFSKCCRKESLQRAAVPGWLQCIQEELRGDKALCGLSRTEQFNHQGCVSTPTD